MAARFRQWLIEIAALTAATFVIAFLGPFGTYALGGLESRILYWATLLFGGYALFRAPLALAPRLARQLELAEPIVWAAIVTTGSMPLTLVVAWLDAGRWPTPVETLRLYPNVLVVSLMMTLLFWAIRPMVGRGASAVPAPSGREAVKAPMPRAAAPASGPGPRLLERLPPGQRGRVRALETEDHYVRVHTDRGAPLVLIRMRDAVAEMEGVTGLQVHRSWWVAADAVERHETDGRNVRLWLAGGLRVPVARASVDAARRAGLLR